MNWNEQLSSITIGTLFRLFGKCLLASLLWIVLFYAIIILTMILLMVIWGPAF